MNLTFCLRLFTAVLLLAPVMAFGREVASPELQDALQSLPYEAGAGVDQRALTEFYALRQYAPAWQLGSNSQRTGQEFEGFVRALLDEHGLSPRNYPLQLFTQKLAQPNPRSLLEADILASAIVLKLGKSLSGGDAIPSSDPDHVWPLRRERPDLAKGLEAAIASRRVPQYLEGLAPPYSQYVHLKEALARYRTIAAKGGWIRLVPGNVYTPGAPNAQTPQLYERLAQEGYLPFVTERFTNPVYDQSLLNALRAFQEGHGLIPDAAVGAQTFLALNIGVNERIDEIRANLARMRVTPPDAWEGIVINIPSFRLMLYRGGEQVYEAPVVVGRPDRASPLTASTISDIIINPPWYVPGSIAEKDILPKLRNNPNYLEEAGLEGPSDMGDMDSASSGQFWQKPGPGNSLGRIKFNFANRFGVYLHGTPHVELFDRDDRRQSSGCIRLKKPEELMEILMGNSAEWSEAGIQERIDSMKTMHIPPRMRIGIKLLYWTVMVDKQSRVQFYNDVYQLDDAWLSQL